MGLTTFVDAKCSGPIKDCLEKGLMTVLEKQTNKQANYNSNQNYKRLTKYVTLILNVIVAFRNLQLEF